MTQEELDRIEARVQSAAGWMQVGKQMPWDGFTEARELAVEQNLALIAEVRRLRGLVEAAYEEGVDHGIGSGWSAWLESESYGALNGGAV